MIVLVLTGLGGVFLGYEWSIERQWQRYATEARERNVKLLLTDFAQPPIPDEKNFAALPMWTRVFTDNAAGELFKLPDHPETKKIPGFGDVMKNESIDWSAWQTYFQKAGYLKEVTSEPARDVLTALDHYAPQFAEWNEGQSRPECRFPLDLAKGADMALPHLAVFQNITKLLALRLRAHLALGESSAALNDLKTGLQGYERLTNHPTMIGGLVRISLLSTLVFAVGDGLKDHAWRDVELREIQTELGKVDLQADYRLALGSEHGFLNTVMDSTVKMSALQRGRHVAQWEALESKLAGLDGANSWRSYAWALIPRSVFRKNQLRANHYLEELLAQADTASGKFDPDRPTPSALSPDPEDWEHRYYFSFGQSFPVYASVARKYIVMQTRLDQARLACALERDRLARGAYPDKLSQLVPEFIESVSEDVYARAPYRYLNLEGKSFRLYGVGQNRMDDGGAMDPKKSEARQADEIWWYAPGGN